MQAYDWPEGTLAFSPLLLIIELGLTAVAIRVFYCQRIESLKSNIGKISNRKVKDRIGFSEKKINFLNKEISGHKIEIRKLNRKISSLHGLMLNMDRFLVVPKFKNLSVDEIRGKTLKDIIFVEEPSSFSEKTLKFLKEAAAFMERDDTGMTNDK